MRALTHEAAAIVHGLPIRDAEPSICVAVSRAAHTPTEVLPAFRYRERNCPVPVEQSVEHPVYFTHPPRGCVLLRRHSISIPDEEIIAVNGLPVTTLLRTALDCACDLPAGKAIVTVDAAVRAACKPPFHGHDNSSWHRWQLIQTELQNMLSQHTGRRGIVKAREVIRIADPLSESPGESVVRWLVAALGLPLPQAQQEVFARGNVYYLDLGWPQYRRAIEFDGFGKYGTGETLHSEKRRQEDIHSLGIDFLRLTWDDITNIHRLSGRLLNFFPPELALNAQRNSALWSW